MLMVMLKTLFQTRPHFEIVMYYRHHDYCGDDADDDDDDDDDYDGR